MHRCLRMAERTKCPECGVSVNVENLPAHYGKQHPRSQVPETLVQKADAAARARRPPASTHVTRSGVRLIAVVAVILGIILAIVIINPFRIGPNVGQEAPDFTLATTTGGTMRLAAYRGTPVLLEFMDVDCPSCQAEAPVLTSVYHNYTPSVVFLSVDVNFVESDDTNARIETFKATYGTPWTYALDRDRAVQNAFGVTRTPTTLVLNRNGVIVQILTGSQASGASAYASALEAALRA